MTRASLLLVMLLGGCTQRTLQDDSVWDPPGDSTSGSRPSTTSGSPPVGDTSSGASPGFAETSSSGGPPVCVDPSPEGADVVVSVELSGLDPASIETFEVPCLLLQREGAGSEPTTFLFQCETLPPELSPILVVEVDAPEVVIPAEITDEGVYDVRFMHWRHPTNAYRLADAIAISRDGTLSFAAAAGSHLPDEGFFSPFSIQGRATGCLEEPPLECHRRGRGELEISLGDTVESIPDLTVAKAFDYDVQVAQMYVTDSPSCGELAQFWMSFALARA